MSRILTAVVLIPLVLVAVFKAPLWLLGLLILFVALVCTEEFLKLAIAGGVVPFLRLSYLTMIVFFLATAGRTVIDDLWAGAVRAEGRAALERHSLLLHAGQSAVVLWLVLLTMPMWFLLRALARADLRSALAGAAASVFPIFYIGLPLLALFQLRVPANGAAVILYLFLVVWSGDIAAYYVGRARGKHKLAPRISPGKSWEGSAASLLASAAVGTAILTNSAGYLAGLAGIRLAARPSVMATASTAWWLALVLSIGVNIAAQLGDLVESMLKRGAAVKDSGAILPGHGGALDRIDALLFAAPLVWYYAIFHLLTL